MSDARNGIECIECGTLELGDRLRPFDECSNCGSDNTNGVIVTTCPFGDEGNDRCHDEEHHYGRGDHVHTVED